MPKKRRIKRRNRRKTRTKAFSTNQLMKTIGDTTKLAIGAATLAQITTTTLTALKK